MAPTDELEQSGAEYLEESPDSEPKPQYGPNNEKLPKQLVEAIRAAITEFQQQEKFTRRREVLHDRKNRFYERGYQHILWSSQSNCFTLVSAGGQMLNPNGQMVQCPTFIDDYNIFFPFLDILTAILTQNPPGVNFQPNDPSKPEDIDKSRSAEDYSHAWDRMNDRPAIQAEIVRMMGLSGRVVSWTRTEEDGQKFGYNDDGSPKEFQRTTIHGTLETKVPISAREFDGGFLYCFLYDDPDVKWAKWKYPDIKKEIKAGTAALGENIYERTARLGVLNGTRAQAQLGDAFTHLTARINAFLRPAAFTGERYEEIFDEAEEGDVNEDGSAMTVGEKLNQLFPDGCRAVFVGDVYAQSFAESMDDHIDVRFPCQGDGMFRQAFMDPMSVNQDVFNDLMNPAHEEFDTGWAAIWFNADDEELDAVRSQRAAPNAIRGWKCRDGLKMQDSIYEEKGPELPPSFEQFLQLIMGQLPQFQLAAPPAIFGSAMEDQKTASGYAQARSQAMGRLGVIWANIQRMFARIRYQAALAASKCQQMNGEITIPGKDGQQPLTINLDRLKKGDFGCYPDEDSSFPESTQQKRSTFQQVVTMAEQSPVVMQMLDNPDNIATAKRLWGLDELVLLPAEARDKQLAEIEILLQQAPLPPDPGEMFAYQAVAGQAIAIGQPAPPPPGPQPSVPVDELDFHVWEFQKCQEWLSSKARRDEDAKGNQAGVMNVKLHALAHKAMIPAAPPMPVLPAGKKAGPPPQGSPAPAPVAPPAAPI